MADQQQVSVLQVSAPRGRTGIFLGDLPPDTYSMKVNRGQVFVLGVAEASPVADLIQAGDVIVGISGKDVRSMTSCAVGKLLGKNKEDDEEDDLIMVDLLLERTAGSLAVVATSTAQDVVAALKSKEGGLVPMNSYEIEALSSTQAHAIVQAKASINNNPSSTKNSASQVKLFAQALAHANTQAQIAMGIYKGKGHVNVEHVSVPRGRAGLFLGDLPPDIYSIEVPNTNVKVNTGQVFILGATATSPVADLVQAGDVIVGVNGQDVRFMTSEAIGKLLGMDNESSNNGNDDNLIMVDLLLERTAGSPAVVATSTARDVVGALKSKEGGLVPMDSFEIESLSRTQAHAIVQANAIMKNNPFGRTTFKQRAGHLKLFTQALAHTNTQEQIAMGIYKGKRLPKTREKKRKRKERIVIPFGVKKQSLQPTDALCNAYAARVAAQILKINATNEVQEAQEVYDEAKKAFEEATQRLQVAQKHNNAALKKINDLDPILGDEDYKWDKHDDKWSVGLMQLLRYKEEIGGGVCTNVPLNFPGFHYSSASDLSNFSLGKWVVRQRQCHRVLQRGASNKPGVKTQALYPWRKKMLDDIDFDWGLDVRPHEACWDEMYQNLLEYKSRHGSFDDLFLIIPSLSSEDNDYENSTADYQLAKWVKQMRAKFYKYRHSKKQSVLWDTRMQMLEDAGLYWTKQKKKWWDKPTDEDDEDIGISADDDVDVDEYDVMSDDEKNDQDEASKTTYNTHEMKNGSQAEDANHSCGDGMAANEEGKVNLSEQTEKRSIGSATAMTKNISHAKSDNHGDVEKKNELQQQEYDSSLLSSDSDDVSTDTEKDDDPDFTPDKASDKDDDDEDDLDITPDKAVENEWF